MRRGPPEPIDFDVVADDYVAQLDGAVSFVGLDADFFAQVRARRLVETACTLFGDASALHALDVGCGVGLMHRHLPGAFATLTGTDVGGHTLELARAANPWVAYVQASRERLPFADSEFDLAFVAGVVQVLPEADRPGFFAELARVVRPGGRVAIFEHNPLNPLTRLAVRRCSFAGLIARGSLERLLGAAGLVPELRSYFLFLPSRRAAGLERHLARVPLGAQYAVWAVRPVASAPAA